MSFPSRVRNTDFSHSAALSGVIRILNGVLNEMIADGFEEEATSLTTTIDDLHWQYEELIEKELLRLWPAIPRRAARAPANRRGPVLHLKSI
jgi:hypothetical protein